MLDTQVGVPITRDEPDDLVVRLVRGVVGGEFAGAAFAVVTMWFFVAEGKTAATPLLMIGTVAPGDGGMLDQASGRATGLLVHLALSALFGALFALVVPRLTTNGSLLIAGAVFGTILFLINLRVLAPLFFPAFREANAAFELLVHWLYGVILALAFLSRGVRSAEPKFGWR